QSIRESGNRSPTEQSTRAYLAQTVISPEELVGELEDSRAVPQITVDPNLAEPSVRPTLDSGAVASGLEDTDFQVNWCDGATLIGRFRIRQLLGTGAFGAVYLADDPHLD